MTIELRKDNLSVFILGWAKGKLVFHRRVMNTGSFKVLFDDAFAECKCVVLKHFRGTYV